MLETTSALDSRPKAFQFANPEETAPDQNAKKKKKKKHKHKHKRSKSKSKEEESE